MRESVFDTSSPDSQGTWVQPLAPESFDADAYAAYSADLDERCKKFWASDGGVLVHRRFRVPQVYAGLCRDMELSLGLQLSALKQSMGFAMDIPNFLEPWYGIGVVPCAYGADLYWSGDLAPATSPLFRSVADALKYEPREIADTPAGRHTLNMIDYFLEKTQGKIPISLSDVQSPLNAAAALVDTSEFYMSFLEDPDETSRLLDRITSLVIPFYKKQAQMIGSRLVFPGHGFSSSRAFSGIGFSDDNSIMLSPDVHRDVCGPSMLRFGEAFGGFAFHSCGNWSAKTEMIKKLPGLTMVDGAFTQATDPAPNPAEPFAVSFANTGVCVNIRMVGSEDEILRTVSALKKPGMKITAVSYCETGAEQQKVYDAIHAL